MEVITGRGDSIGAGFDVLEKFFFGAVAEVIKKNTTNSAGFLAMLDHEIIICPGKRKDGSSLAD